MLYIGQIPESIMNIQIKPELEKIIQAQIAISKYANAEGVISQALK